MQALAEVPAKRCRRRLFLHFREFGLPLLSSHICVQLNKTGTSPLSGSPNPCSESSKARLP